MIKFFLSIFMLLLMPFRVLFVLSILFNIAAFIVLSDFIKRDSYLEAAKHFEIVKKQADKVLENSCNYGVKCSIKLYAKNGKEGLEETFAKTINSNKVEEKSFFESIKAPLRKILSESELSNTISIQSQISSNNCFKGENNSLVCSNEALVAVFEAENCSKCLSNFEKEFNLLNQPYYKSFLIKITHKIYNFFKSFASKTENTEEEQDFIKNIKVSLIKFLS